MTKLSVPNVIRLNTPIKMYGVYRRHILDEPSFVEYVLNQKMDRETLLRVHGVSANTFNLSQYIYRDKYSAELRALKHHRYATAMKGNVRGAKDQPGVVIDKDKLQKMLNDGASLSVMAEHFKTSAWFVRANMKRLSLSRNGKLPFKMQRLDGHYLAQLEALSPGLTAAAHNHYTNPLAYFDRLHYAFLKTIELVWFIKEQAQSHDYYLAKKKIPKSHIAWSQNRSETLLSLGLLNAGIPHIREYAFYKNYRADFYFPEIKLLVEIDGEYHTTDAATRLRDKQRHRHARRLGYIIVRFTTARIKRDLPWVIEQIRVLLLEKSPASGHSGCKMSGTSA